MKWNPFAPRPIYHYCLYGLSILIVFSSACNVVVPRFATATEFGFTLSGELDTQEPYSVGTLRCKTELYPNKLLPTEDASASAAYIATLNTAFPGWTFNNAATSLSKEAIEIKTYDAIGTATQVGVWIHARYVPHAGDPTENIHWVQILTTNHGLRGTGHGPIATYVDVNTGTTTPYYDEGYAGDARDIIDRPSRTDASMNHTWQATTFLVAGPDIGDGAGTVTLLGPGFTWGWENTCEQTDGLQEFYYYQTKPDVASMQVRPVPGGRLQLTVPNSASLILAKGENSATVPVLSKEMSFSIDKEVDPWGMVALTNGQGKMNLGGFEFAGKKMLPVTAEISKGSGHFHIETGEASMEYEVSLLLPDGTTETIVFVGTGQYDKEKNTFTLNPDVTGISASFLKSNVPKDTGKTKK